MAWGTLNTGSPIGTDLMDVTVITDRLDNLETGFTGSGLSAINIDGGTIDGVPIGGTSAAAGAFTTFSATSSAIFNSTITASGAIVANSAIAGTVISTTGSITCNSILNVVGSATLSSTLIVTGRATFTSIVVNSVVTGSVTFGSSLTVTGGIVASSAGFGTGVTLVASDIVLAGANPNRLDLRITSGIITTASAYTA